MKTGTILSRVLIGLVVIGTVLSTFFIVKAAYQQRLGPALDPVPPTAVPTNVPLIAAATSIPTSEPVVSMPTPTAVQTTTCGETGSWNLLILGVDTVVLRGDRGADLTRMMRLDFPNGKVTIYTFPRELWVNTSGLGLTNPTIDATELGTVFYEALLRSHQTTQRNAMVDGTNATARMLSWNFSLRTDHYMTVDVSQAPAMIDAIGGVPITQTAMRFLRIAYHDYQGVVLDAKGEASLLHDLGEGEALILRNHGLLTVGATVGEAFNWMHRLELSCRSQLAAMATGAKLNAVPADVLEKTYLNYQPRTRRPYGVMEWPALLRMLDRIDPGFRG